MVIRRTVGSSTSTSPSRPRDPNTLSNYHEFLTTHTVANFDIDFQKKALHGSVTLTLKSLTDAHARDIVLDSSYLHVKNITCEELNIEWGLDPRLEPYGSALSISLERGIPKGESRDVTVRLDQTCSHYSMYSYRP